MHGEGFADDAPFAVVLEHREVVGITLAEPVIDDLYDCDIESDFEHVDLRMMGRAWHRRGRCPVPRRRSARAGDRRQ